MHTAYAGYAALHGIVGDCCLAWHRVRLLHVHLGTELLLGHLWPLVQRDVAPVGAVPA